MDTINNLINQIKGINRENIIDLVIAIIIIILFFMISNVISYAIIRIFKIKTKNKEKIKNNGFYKPLRNLIRITGIYVGIMILKLPAEYGQFIVKLYKIAIIICVANGFANIFNPKSKIFNKLQEKTKFNGDERVAGFISKIIKVIIYFIAGYLVLLELGYNLGGLITGLGISSVVIALAAQDLAKNLLGGFTIIMDKPFKIGDWIEIGSYSGTVIDITFRSTKLKATDNEIVILQNSVVSESSLKNWGNLDKRRYSVTLSLPLETSQQTIEKIINKIRFSLKSFEDIIEDSLQVHFSSIAQTGLGIVIYFNTLKTDYTEYEYLKDKVNLELIKILESENVKLAYTGQNIYINNLDEEKKTKKA